jgi:hypothetical protein
LNQIISGFSFSKTSFKLFTLQKLKGDNKSHNLFFRCHFDPAGSVLHHRITSCQRDSNKFFTSWIYVSIHHALLIKSLIINIFFLSSSLLSANFKNLSYHASSVYSGNNFLIFHSNSSLSLILSGFVFFASFSIIETILSEVVFHLAKNKLHSWNMKGSSHHFLYPITGTHRDSAFNADNQKVSKNSDGIKQ